MSDEEIRITIAEACGVCVPEWRFNGVGEVCNKCGKLDYAFGHKQQHDPFPDYPKDLNAMHEAEKLINQYQKKSFFRHLHKSVNLESWNMSRENSFTMIHATARQRAEAFLRAIGKWKD